MRILYQDEYIAVVHKAAGESVQSSRVGEPDLVSMLMNETGSPFIGIVHRLDRPVEGVMVFAKTKEAAAYLSEQIRERKTEKIYDAFTVPDMGQEYADGDKGSEGTVTLTDFILFDRRTNTSSVVPEGTAGGKKAVLEYSTEKIYDGEHFSIAHLRIRLHTGRHHQIRVQLSNAGLPILGDRKYAAIPDGYGGPLCLGASKLSFDHPADGRRMHYELEPEFVTHREDLIANL